MVLSTPKPQDGDALKQPCLKFSNGLSTLNHVSDHLSYPPARSEWTSCQCHWFRFDGYVCVLILNLFISNSHPTEALGRSTVKRTRKKPSIPSPMQPTAESPSGIQQTSMGAVSRRSYILNGNRIHYRS